MGTRGDFSKGDGQAVNSPDSAPVGCLKSPARRRSRQTLSTVGRRSAGVLLCRHVTAASRRQPSEFTWTDGRSRPLGAHAGFPVEHADDMTGAVLCQDTDSQVAISCVDRWQMYLCSGRGGSVGRRQRGFLTGAKMSMNGRLCPTRSGPPVGQERLPPIGHGRSRPAEGILG